MNDQVLAELIHVVESKAVANKLKPAVADVLDALIASPKEPQAWEPLQQDFFGARLPDGIKSGWLFALRNGAVFGNERHPNSWQPSIALQGAAEFELLLDGVWKKFVIHPSGSADGAVSIPPNVWHRIRIGPKVFVSLSFHTAPASELIEETSEGDDLTRTKRRLYASH